MTRAEVGAHSHNDYEQSRPLLEALENGFGSIEADVFLVKGQLLVGHNSFRLKPHLTLESMYLEPLRVWFKSHPEASPGQRSLQLLVDVKTDPDLTWIALHQVFTNYTDILTCFTPTGSVKRLATVVISGNRSVEIMNTNLTRFAAFDGRLVDLKNRSTFSSALIPLVSGSWSESFKWKGQGTLPDEEKKVLKEWVSRTHNQGRTLRFWGAPDGPDAWKEFFEAGVDWINTDHIKPLAEFLKSKAKPAIEPRKP